MTFARFTARLLAAAALCVATTSALAAPPPPETFFSDPDIGEAVLSPSGKKLAFTSAKGAPRVGLVVLDLAPGGKLTRVVQSAASDVVSVHWVNEDRLVFSLTDLGEASGMHRQAPGLFAVNADGSRMRMLVSRQKYFISNGDTANADALHPNHRLMMIPSPRAGEANNEVLLAELGWIEGSVVESPVWVNVNTASTRPYTGAAPSNAVHWTVDDRGNARAVVTRKNDRVQAWWLPAGKTEWTQLFDTPVLDQPFFPQGVADDGSLYVVPLKGTPFRVLTRYDAEAKAPVQPPLVRVPGFDFNGYLLKEEGVVLGVRTMADSEATVWLDERMKKFQSQVDQLLAGKINSINCLRCGKPDMVALVRSFNDHDPGKLWLYQAQPPAGENRWRAIGGIREAVDPAQMAGVDLQTIKARDGHEVPVWITRPDTAKGPLPAVVLVHGGPWMRGSAWQWNGWAQFLASRGYVVIEPEFRGSTGYGEAHYRAGFKQWGQAMQDDVTDALRWAQKQGLASDKACIMGPSYGGYSTLMGVAKDPDLYRCGVAWVAVSDLELLVQGAWWVPDDSSRARRLTIPEMVGDAKADAAMLAANSPVKLAARMKAPLLLAYGEEDVRVPLAHGKRMREALVAAGHPPEWVSYPGEAHGFTKFDNRIDFARRVEAFLAKHLASAPQ